MLVSIIMPAYNSEEFIKKAIESVLMQSYKEFELIIVDDGSIDDTFRVCEWYRKKDNRIKIYRKNNGGVCSARNYGIDKAHGEYITFCDNDDTYDRDLLNQNIGLAVKNDADVVRWNFTTYVDGGKEGKRDYNNAVLLTKEQLAEAYMDLRQTNDAIWNGLFKRKFLEINGIKFNEHMKYGGEDLHFSLQVLNANPKVVLNNESYYNWFLRTNHSTSGKYDTNFCDTMLINADYEYILMKKIGVDMKQYWNAVKSEYESYITSYASHISWFIKKKYQILIRKSQWYKDEG